ncbi:MAG: prolipoprotein diacylglyceryl transferase [Burkholderiales bacterium]|jgi:phosphatidylglycerol:prolipoprotein diacylglycerol transferase|nr:prolipoprotein diacylglyceryl transferase [Burkholderiales bacterium]
MIVYPHIDPVALSIGKFSIHWYGLMYLIAFLIFMILARYRIKKGRYPGWTSENVDDLMFYGVLAVVLGARLGYVLFYKPAYYFDHPWEVFQVWMGGMSFHGGFLGVLIAVTIYAYRHRRHWFDVTDFIAPLIPLGLAAGRLGNFINGELWGRPTNADWGMIFPHVDRLPRHPSQLYELSLEGIALFLILWFFSKSPKPRAAVSGLFLIGYGAFRFLIEFTRQPDAFLPPLPLHLTMGQWLSLPMFLAGVVMMIAAYRIAAKKG